MTTHVFVDLDTGKRVPYDTETDTATVVHRGLGFVDALRGEIEMIVAAVDRGREDEVLESIFQLDIEIHDPIHGNCY